MMEREGVALKTDSMVEVKGSNASFDKYAKAHCIPCRGNTSFCRATEIKIDQYQ